MSFTNQTLSVLGTAAGIAAAADHISKQNQTNENLKKSNELKQKDLDLQKAELVQTIDNDKAALDEQDQYVESELQRLPGYNEEIANSSTDDKLKLLEGYAGGDVINAKKGVELERARKALETVQGKIEARRQLQFDIDMAKKKLRTIVRS